MLAPEYLAGLPDRLVGLYAAVEQDILADMARRIREYDFYIPAAQHQRQRLRAMGLAEEEIVERLSALTGESREKLQKLMEQAAERSLAADAAVYSAAGTGPVDPLAVAGVRAVLHSGLAQTGGVFENLTRTTAHTAGKQFTDALDRAWLQITSGGFDYHTAIRIAVKDLARQGMASVTYPSGHTDTLEVAVRRAVVTGCNQTAAKAQLTLMDELGIDLVETTAHRGARPSHQVWQGRVFSRSGRSGKYPDFVSSTGYGTGPGLCGWNCSHSFGPYIEGAPRAYSPELLARYEKQTVTYNGKALTLYEAGQQQRYIERQIRRWKREYAAMDGAGLDTGEATAKISAWREREKEFCWQTGLKRQGERSQVSGFGRSWATKAHSMVAKYEKIHYHKDGTIIVTDDWTEKEHFKIPKKYRPNAVVDTLSQNGKQHDRTIYDENGVINLQVHGGPHGQPKRHPYGRHGEHVHDYVWIPGRNKPERSTREASDQERIWHKDILGGAGDDS